MYILGTSCMLIIQGLTLSYTQDIEESTGTITVIMDDIPFDLVTAMSWVCYICYMESISTISD